MNDTPAAPAPEPAPPPEAALRRRVLGALEPPRDRVAQSLGSLARAARRAAEELRGERRDVLAPYADRLAGAIDRWAAALRTRDAEAILREALDFGRRSPALCLAASVATGFVLARLAQASVEPAPEPPAAQRPEAAGAAP